MKTSEWPFVALVNRPARNLPLRKRLVVDLPEPVSHSIEVVWVERWKQPAEALAAPEV
ncbi:hypothetical protein BH23CHL5_BH23CHL5_23380 [soil metagenome]